ncbi:hypothetical protein N356_gp094 [Cellulophaga phage phi14:2]|uniref:Uncharacterized protein n=1 Tax=Cellulophaga phage phi14:2 TaxID=1327990 RepID=S0A0U3_9CAUD|nr:hypothetical protein N356_gp094 [Cellulophaga phage phi14:2]AGO48986.1 hypothetical protein Phi14:2_gp108 [Cellulophaga phage phi14:2]
MINKKLRKDLHTIALDNKVSDTVAEMIIMSPFLFQKRKLEEGNLEGRTTFYHKYLCKFFIKEKVLIKIKEKNEFGK